MRIELKLSHPKLLPPRINEKFYKSNITSINKQNMNSGHIRLKLEASQALHISTTNQKKKKKIILTQLWKFSNPDTTPVKSNELDPDSNSTLLRPSLQPIHVHLKTPIIQSQRPKISTPNPTPFKSQQALDTTLLEPAQPICIYPE